MARGEQLETVLEYVRNNRGEWVRLDQIKNATGYQSAQVQAAMRTIINRGIWPIATQVGGRIWKIGVSEHNLNPVTSPPTLTERTRPTSDEETSLPSQATPIARRTISAPKPPTRPEIIRKPVTDDQSNHLFEYLGARPGGKLLLRRDDGALFEATLEPL